VLTAASVSALAWSVRGAGLTQTVVLLLGMTVLGICYGGLQNLTLVVSFDSVARADYGRASAVWNIGFDLGTGLGSVLIGVVAAGTSFAVALLAAAAFSLATLPLAVYRPGSTTPLRETPSAG
jgi:predicted MFS family arabinose efflux permease